MRRVIASQANAIMKKQFAGDVAIERIGSLGLRGIDGVRVRVKDRRGCRCSTSTARAFAFAPSRRRGPRCSARETSSSPSTSPRSSTSTPPSTATPPATCASRNAFAEKTPTPAKPSDPNARGVRVEAPSVALRAAWVHGQAAGAPPVDAELHELVAHAHYDAKLIKADLDRVDLVTRGLPRGVDPRGRIGGKFSMPSATGKDMSVTAAFDGMIAGVPTSANAQMDGPKIDAVVDGRDPSGEGVRATFGEVAVKEEVTLHAEAHGELPKIAGQAHLALGRGTVDVDGHADLSDGTKVDAVIAVRHVDLHGVVASAPVSDVGLDTKLDVAIAKSGEIKGNVVLDTLPGQVAGQTLPLLKLRGEFTKETAHATGRIVDPRATADFDVGVTNASTNPLIAAHLHGDVADLSRLPDLGAPMKGHAVLDVDGTANLGSKAIAARAHVVAGGPRVWPADCGQRDRARHRVGHDGSPGGRRRRSRRRHRRRWPEDRRHRRARPRRARRGHHHHQRPGRSRRGRPQRVRRRAARAGRRSGHRGPGRRHHPASAIRSTPTSRRPRARFT